MRVWMNWKKWNASETALMVGYLRAILESGRLHTPNVDNLATELLDSIR